MKSKIISASRAVELFAYDPETGVVSRRFATTAKAAVGPITGRDNGDGYGRVTIDGQRVYLHRLAWLLHHGEWPRAQVDHVDGDRSNNRASNLRDVDHTANAQNVHKARGRVGLLGVSYDSSRQKYTAQISVGPRKSARVIHLGRYSTPEEAHRAYLRAKAKYHPAASIAA